MLKFLTISAILLAIAIGQETELGETETSETETSETETSETELSGETEISATVAALSNYFVDTFSSLVVVPYAINQCSYTSIGGGSYIKPTCSDSKVTVNKYSDSSCTTLTSTATYNSSSDEDFYCDGEDTYMEVSFGLAGDCGSKTFVALDVCLSFSSYYASFSCGVTTSTGALALYSTSTCDTTALGTNSFTATCGVGFTFSGYTIYAEVHDCSTVTSSVDTTDTATVETTAAGNMVGIKQIIAIFVMVFGLIVAAF
jgi:hypothetical protein